MTTSIYDYTHFYCDTNSERVYPHRLIGPILIEQGFRQLPCYKKRFKCFKIDRFDNSFSSHNLPHFNIYSIYGQLKLPSREEYYSYDELVKLNNMLDNESLDIRYTALTIISGLNIAFCKQILDMKRIHKHIFYSIQSQAFANPYVGMHCAYMQHVYKRSY